jgi:hypothetical protein
MKKRLHGVYRTGVFGRFQRLPAEAVETGNQALL